ncbi:MAG: amidohydrolase family protein [Myxococcota bacterium]|nr:amidohydrolase family protein [Myxococcota bacterium]
MQPEGPEDLILVSVDDHVVEPPDLFEGHLGAAHRADAPRVVHKADGSDVWVYRGKQIPNIGLNAVVGRPPEEYGMEPTAFDQLRPGTWKLSERIRDMNANGVLASMCFPSFPGFCGQLWLRDDDKATGLVMLRAYNDWHIDEWCGTHPGRFIPLAIVPMWDPALAAEEVRRVARKGCHAISFSENPTKLDLPSLHDLHWDPLWQACADEGTLVCIHIGSGQGMQFTSMDAPIDVMISTQPAQILHCAADLLWSHMLKRYPTLKFALSEGGIGWVPYLLERADYVYAHHHRWTGQDFGGKLPSEVWREHIVTCFIDDATGLRNRHDVGLDTITWECDYPHSDTTWPNAPEILWKSLEGIPGDEIDQITHGNALRHFRLDPFAHRSREQCTVKALRAEAGDVDLRVASQGGKPPSADRDRPVSVHDVTTQLMSAFQTPAE